MRCFNRWLVVSGFLLFNTVALSDTDVIKPYPPAEKGYKRMVINLKAVADENDKKLEIIIGKTHQCSHIPDYPGTNRAMSARIRSNKDVPVIIAF